MLAGLFLYALIGLAFPLATSVEHLILIRIVHGVGSAMITPIAMSYVGDLAPPEEEGRYMGMFNIALFSGIAHPEAVNWHTLRHTAASQWLRHGIDVFTVSRRSGHASAAFTMDTYGHLLKGQQRAAAEALDYLLEQA